MAFQIGQTVESLTDLQGLRKGQRYQVTDVNTVHVAGRAFTRVEVWSAESRGVISVVNPHVVLSGPLVR